VTLRPPRLKGGDRIGVVAPAGPVSPPEILPGMALLESLGFEVCGSQNLYERRGYLAGEDGGRLQDLHSMFRDRRVKAILCARGGFGTLRLIDKIDFALIRENPKIIVGYSDITALLLALQKETGLITFHGPVVRDLAKNESRNLGALLRLLSEETPPAVDLQDARILREGEAEGLLLGGNLSLLCHLVGTRFMPSLKGALLFLEEKGEPLYRIDRMLTHLRLSGRIGDCGGLIAGTFEECGDLSSIDELLREKFSDLNIPILAGLPAGHGEANIALPIGLRATLNTDRKTLTMMEPCVGP